MILLTDLLVAPTSDQIKQSIYKVLGKIGSSVTVWKPGAVARTIIAAVSIVLGAFAQWVAMLAASGYLALARGGWLTLLARYQYGVERNLATFASGAVNLVNTSGSLYSFSAGDLLLQNPDTKKTYTNTEDITINPGSSLLGVAITAQEIGSASTSIANTVVATLPAYTGLTCSNPLSVVGTDDELDPDLVVRCLDKLGSLSPNGPSDAYAFVARSAVRANGQPIGINRIQITRDGYGNIYLVVASPAGPVLGTQDDPASDLGAVYLLLLKKATPLCVTPRLSSAVALAQDVTYTAYAYNDSGLDGATALATISKALASLFAGLPIGGHVLLPGVGYVYVDELKAAITAAVPSIFHIVFGNISGDVVTPSGRVLALGAVNGAMQFVPRVTL